MTRRMRPIIAGLMTATAFLAVGPAAAQELTVGYQFQRFNGDNSDSSESWPVGFGIDASIPLARSVSLVGQFDWSQKRERFTFDDGALEVTARASTFAAGLRWTSHNPDARVFAHALGGGLRLSAGCKVDGVDCRSLSDEDLSETYGIVDVGGGLLFPFSRRMSGVAQVDYRRVFVDGGGTNSVRFLAGVRFGFE